MQEAKGLTKETFTISGMTCAACANAIERGVRKLDGVKEVNVNFASEKMTVDFGSKEINIDAIIQKVVKLGYEVEHQHQEQFKEILLPISGMTCAACSNAVERALKKLDGVKEVSVNFASEKAKIQY